MKTMLILASQLFIFACTTTPPSEPPIDPKPEVAAQDTILKSSDAIPADEKAAVREAAASWEATPGLSPSNCAGCEDKYGNSYATGYTTCFGSIKVTCKGRIEKEPAGSGCYEQADWHKHEEACK